MVKPLMTLLFLSAVTVIAAQQGDVVTYERLRNSEREPQNWMHYWGNYQGTHYSALQEITSSNVSNLELQWSIKLPGSGTAGLETEPLVIDGIMYTSGQPGAVLALDAKTGKQIWKFTRERKVKNPNEINPYNRGVAVLGNRVFVGTLDAALVAIDARTGEPLWETQVADSMLGYSITSSPLVVKDKVVVGVSGGEFGAPGFLDAYDVATGKRVWQWHSIPGPGELGNNSWAGDSWKHGGGPMWLTGSFDPDLDTLYWTVGNPGAQIDRSERGGGDNLFTDSVVALDPDSGQRKWHYQFTPNDGHDWDSTEDLVLVDRMWRGENRKLLLQADRNGHFYVLDRTNGNFLDGTPFVYQNWNRGFNAAGKPIQVSGSNSSSEGSFYVYPTVGGATNFQAPSYSPVTGWFYLAYQENGQQYVSAPAPFEAGRQYIGRGRSNPEMTPRPGEPYPSAGIKALDPENGKTVWDSKLSRGSINNGLMATAGGVIFAASRDGDLMALDAQTGRSLWRHHTGGDMRASPMSFAVDGRQYVAVASGDTIFCFALPNSTLRGGDQYLIHRNADVVTLEDSKNQVSVSILPSVGNIAFSMKVKGQEILRWPYASVEEFKAKPALSGIPFVGPWANRLDEQAFYANGKRYAFDMSLGNVRGAIPIHGFLSTTDQWRVVEAKTDEKSTWVTSRLEFFKEPAWMKQFPFAHTIDMTYRLQDGVLEVHTKITNMSGDSMPVAVGFHPYYKLTDSTREDWTISVGAAKHWKLSPSKIPTGETEPADKVFPDPGAAALKNYDLDDVFSDLVRDAQGRAHMMVKGKRQQLEVMLDPNWRSIVIWSPAAGVQGDANFIAFEPMAGITDAMNLAHKGLYKELQSIPAGGNWEASFWVKPAGF